VKLVLFVEGLTESKAVPPFLRRWLDLDSETFSLSLTPPSG